MVVVVAAAELMVSLYNSYVLSLAWLEKCF